MQLPDKAMEVHSPNGHRPAFKDSLKFRMSTLKKSDRVSDIVIDKSENIFELNY
ncbi:hypothetical protein [Nonlabens sp.]|uniref:hypothetical protein n=1 Tax=Nonlabens sp. TaxID=1888209 RepID=UPI0039E2DC18